jgi:hypothetical protein
LKKIRDAMAEMCGGAAPREPFGEEHGALQQVFKQK